MSGRIFDINEEPKEHGSPESPPLRPERMEKPARPPKGPQRWRPVLLVLLALLVLAIGAGLVSIWTLRKRIQSVVFPTSAPSPTPPELAAGKTKFETFTAKYGAVVIRGGTVTGTVSGLLGGTISTEAVQLTNASTKETTEGIVFQIVQGGYVRTPSSSVVDYDEVDSLLKGLDYVAKADPSITPLKSFSAMYRSRGGLQVFVFNDVKGQINAGVASGEVTGAHVYLKLDDLAKFREQIVTAKRKLDGVKGKPQA